MFEDILFPSSSKHMQYAMHCAGKTDPCMTPSQSLKELSGKAGNVGTVVTMLKTDQKQQPLDHTRNCGLRFVL